jgi:hypothetical protein
LGLEDGSSWRFCLRTLESVQPWFRFESVEGVARFGQQRARVVGTFASDQPCGVLELNDGQEEGELEGAELGFGGGEVAVCAGVVASEACAET